MQKGVVDVTVSSTSPRCYGKPEQVLDINFDGDWTSNNDPNSYYQIQFRNIKAQLTGYTIQTNEGNAGTTHAKSWKLEGSNDGFQWATLDNVSNSSELNGKFKHVARSFNPVGWHKYFKITQTDKNNFGSNAFTIHRIEFFGQIAEA